jgi:ferredoxin--NADP+ reductase
MNAQVLSRTDVAPGLMILRIAPIGWEIPAFEPGQFTVLGLPWSAERVEWSDEDELASDDHSQLILRAYSIASSSLQKEYMEFYIALVRSGSLTPRLFNLHPGDEVYLSSRITGMFTLKEVPEDKDVIFFATGTGLAPYVSMLRTFLATESGRRLAVLHGARHSWDLGYQAELRSLERTFESFSYFPVISRPGEEGGAWSGSTGYLQDLWRAGVVAREWEREPGPDDSHIFLCGNPLMVEEMLEILRETGWTEHRSRRRPGQVHTEKYW